MDKQITDTLKMFAGAVEKFVENNLMEKHQREENIRKVTSTLDIIMKESLKQGIKVAQQYAAAGAAASSAFAAAAQGDSSKATEVVHAFEEKAEKFAAQADSMADGRASSATSGSASTSSSFSAPAGAAMTVSDYKIQQVPVQVKKLENFKGELPKYQTALASGLDVRAQLETSIEVTPGQRVLVPTGLSFAIPAGYEIQARPRSGWAIKDGMSLLNTPGTIDADYRGEVKIILVNLGEKTLTINDQDRIAQLVLCPVVQAVFQEVTELDSTARGAGGFGSTGR